MADKEQDIEEGEELVLLRVLIRRKTMRKLVIRGKEEDRKPSPMARRLLEIALDTLDHA